MSSIWASGRYQAVGERIAHIAEQVVDAAGRRRPLRDADVVDLACGTGAAALAAAARGARATGVDITPELLDIAAVHDTGNQVTWVTADAADTGLPGGSFSAAVSNMGIIFVEPERQVAEIARLLKPVGVLVFSAWMHATHSPFLDPIMAMFGDAIPATGYSPDQWGDPQIVESRLAGAFDRIEIETGTHTWEFTSLTGAVRFVCEESPMHVNIFDQIDDDQHVALRSAFEAALAQHRRPDGWIAFDVPYAVISAIRSI